MTLGLPHTKSLPLRPALRGLPGPPPSYPHPFLLTPAGLQGGAAAAASACRYLSPWQGGQHPHLPPPPPRGTLCLLPAAHTTPPLLASREAGTERRPGFLGVWVCPAPGGPCHTSAGVRVARAVVRVIVHLQALAGPDPLPSTNPCCMDRAPAGPQASSGPASAFASPQPPPPSTLHLPPGPSLGSLSRAPPPPPPPLLLPAEARRRPGVPASAPLAHLSPAAVRRGRRGRARRSSRGPPRRTCQV